MRALSQPGFDGGRVDVDPSRVAIWGGSAGSTLTAEAGEALGTTGATPVAFFAKELIGHLHSNAYTRQAFCPTVTFLTTYLGPYTGTCVPPPNPGGSGAG